MKQQSILIIDEEEAIRESLQLIFQEEDYRCFIAADEIEAKQILVAEAIDIILIDSLLATPSSFLPFLLSTYPQKIIIVMCSYAEVEVMQRALLEGADDFVMKPLEFPELISKVQQHFQSLAQ